MNNGSIVVLGIESSCDDTSAAVLRDGKMLSNVVAGQEIHKAYGGVVPELASRAHQQNIVPVVDQALKKAGIEKQHLTAIAYTRGPGLMGSLLVGGSFAKSLSQALAIPLIEVNHMQAHVLAHFIDDESNIDGIPDFPFLCLTVSGGHTQLLRVNSPFDFELLGQTLDDAAGEAFDKVAKVLNLPYPGGPLVDKYAKEGNPLAFKFAKPVIPDFNFSFSGLKTGFMNFINQQTAKNQTFTQEHLTDICASIQKTIVDILLDKLLKASDATGIKTIALAGGVSANSQLRKRIKNLEQSHGFKTHIPAFQYCTDNAGMIAITGYLKLKEGYLGNLSNTPQARYSISERENL